MPQSRSASLSLLVLIGLTTAVTTVSITGASALSSDGSRLLALLNQSRRSAGLGALSVDPALSQIAQAHVQKMASQGRLFHNSSLSGAGRGWTAWGENVGNGADADAVYRAFMGSSSHCANILSRTYNLVGIATTWSSGRLWVVEDFAAGSGAASSAAPSPRPAPAPRAAAPAPAPPPPEPAPWVVASEYLDPEAIPICRLVCLTEP